MKEEYILDIQEKKYDVTFTVEFEDGILTHIEVVVYENDSEKLYFEESFDGEDIMPFITEETLHFIEKLLRSAKDVEVEIKIEGRAEEIFRV